MSNLTKRQTEVLEFVRLHGQTIGRPPTRQDIADHFGFKSPNAAEEHLKALARKGALLLDTGRARGIRLPATVVVPTRP